MEKARLVLADDHVLVIEGLTKILEGEFDLVGAAEDGRQLLELCENLKPDAVLLDISLPLLNGIEVTRRITKMLPKTKVLIVTVHSDPEYVTEAFRAGANGYVLKRSATSELVMAVRQILNGFAYVTPLVTQHIVDAVLDKRSDPHTPRLSPRQREVLQLVAEGYSAKEIAATLHISVKTAEFHKGALAAKLGLHNTAEMVKYAISHGISESVIDRTRPVRTLTAAAGGETRDPGPGPWEFPRG